LQLPLTTPGIDGAPVKQVLGPPLPATAIRKFVWPLSELQKPAAPNDCLNPVAIEGSV
jgi:hypothetical protein